LADPPRHGVGTWTRCGRSGRLRPTHHPRNVAH
jgi:hypothetical protein